MLNNVENGDSEIKNRNMNKALLNLDEFCEYLGIGKTKARELLHDPKNRFTVRIGSRLYAHKKKLDEWLEYQVERR
jgi:excisionase family DNA binding protein